MFVALMDEIVSMSLSQQSCVMKGTFLRGAIELGLWLSDKDNQRIVSPALIRAYHLERKAVVPVIRLGGIATTFFKSHMHRDAPSFDEHQPVSRSFLIYSDEQAGESFWFIDYLTVVIDFWGTNLLRPGFAGNAKSARSYKEIVLRFFKNHRNAVALGYKQANKDDVRFKYRWLARYHNSILDEYGILVRDVRISTREVPSLPDAYKIDSLPGRNESGAITRRALARRA